MLVLNANAPSVGSSDDSSEGAPSFSQNGAFVGHETYFSKAALRLIPIPRRLGGGEDEGGVGCAAQMMPEPVRGEKVYTGDCMLLELCGSSARDTPKMHVNALYALSTVDEATHEYKRDKTPPDSAVPAVPFERFLRRSLPIIA